MMMRKKMMMMTSGTMSKKPDPAEYHSLNVYIKDMKSYASSVGKNPNKFELYRYKESGIYSIQDLLNHRKDNPWSRVDL